MKVCHLEHILKNMLQCYERVLIQEIMACKVGEITQMRATVRVIHHFTLFSESHCLYLIMNLTC